MLATLLIAIPAMAADITGIWAGQQQGRRGEPEDVAFRFRVDGQLLKGTMFGDEFDIPIGEASLTGSQLRFTVTTTNYYSGTKVTYTYTGTFSGDVIELIRERIPAPDEKPAKRPVPKQSITLKRLT